MRLVFESAAEHKSQWLAIVSVAAKVGCAPETLRKWVRRTEQLAVPAERERLADRSRVVELERENRELREANEILRKAAVDSIRQCNMFQEVLRREDGSAGYARRAEAGALGSLACVLGSRSARSQWRWRNRRGRCSRFCGTTVASLQRHASADRSSCRWLSERRSPGAWRAANPYGRSPVSRTAPLRASAVK